MIISNDSKSKMIYWSSVGLLIIKKRFFLSYQLKSEGNTSNSKYITAEI